MEEEKESDPIETGGDVKLREAKAGHVDTVDVSVSVTEDVELDYEADEDEKDDEKMIQERKEDTNAEVTVNCTRTPVGWVDESEEMTVGVDEELEEGEVSDEDEEARKERLKPQPVCRFYNKGQCTWGASCRFIHPGVLDTGRYSMFAQPRPILPGAEGTGETSPIKEIESGGGNPANPASAEAEIVPRPETPWERGLRQAKEMRKRSQQRKETDVEYEEKRTNMSLTQAELDKENDYFIRQASPIHDNEDEFGDDMVDVVKHRDDYQRPYESGRRRVAPPPPVDFETPSPSLRRYPPLLREGGRGRYSPTPAPKGRPLPPRSPPGYDDVDSGAVPRRKDDDWADPWMRGGQRRREVSPSRTSVAELSHSRTRPSLRRRSYSSGSSRSSSSSSDMLRARERRRRRGGRRRSSSVSSKSSGSSPSRSRSRSKKSPRSSSPEDIPRRERPFASPPSKKKGVARNEAPLQKRLGTVGSSSSNSASVLAKTIKKEPEDKQPSSSGGDKQKNSNMVPLGTRQATRRTRRSNSSRSSTKSPPRRKIKREASDSPPRKLTSLKSSSSCVGSSSQSKVNRPAVLPVVSTMISPSKQKQSRSGDSQMASFKSPSRGSAPAAKQIKLQIKSSIATKPANKTVLEKLGMSHDDMAHSAHKASNPTEVRSDKRRDAESLSASGISNKKDKPKRKEEKKSAADRREELLKQLKAVENAIAKKRTKISH